MDGTLGDTERHGHRVAFNRAFEQLGLEDRWDEDLYGELLRITGGERRLKHYFVDYRRFPEDKAAELAAKLHPLKTDLFVKVVEDDQIPPRPGVLRYLKELADDGLRLAVATTGTRSWVLPLLEKLCARGSLAPFETIVTGDDVTDRKPHPEAFFLALDRMNLRAREVVIVEDSRNGVESAKAARCVCLAVKGEYATLEGLSAADLVVDNFGEPGSPIQVLHNPWSVDAGEVLSPAGTRDLHRAALAKGSN